MRNLALALFAAAALLPSEAPAATLNVPSSYATIQAAVNAAQAGDIIQVAPGTYRERLYFIGREDLTVLGSGADQTIIRNSDLPGCGEPPPVYVRSSRGLSFSNLAVEGGEVGVVVTSVDADYSPGAPAELTLTDCAVRGMSAVGIFVGAPGCAPLPPGSLAVPACFQEDRQRYVDGSRLELNSSRVENNGVCGESGTGVVFFPGTSGLLQDSFVNANQLTGVFVWGAEVDMKRCVLENNVENAVEYRQYPSPKTKSGFKLPATGTLAGNSILGTLPLPGNLLGGGLVTQAAEMVLDANLISGNRAWGISASNKSRLALTGNSISGNNQAGLIVQKGSAVTMAGDTLSGNGFEGLVAQGSSFVEADTVTISANGRTGVLLQKKSEGHFAGSAISGNGTSGAPYGGIGFQGDSWGSVRRSWVTSHANGAGIFYAGGPREIFVEDNTLKHNAGSAVVLNGPGAVGSVLRNLYGGNSPLDLACPGGGAAYLGAGAEGAVVDPSCAEPSGSFVEVGPQSSVAFSSEQAVGTGRKFAVQASSSLPATVGHSLSGPEGLSGSAAAVLSKNRYLAGGSTVDGDTSLALYNPNSKDVSVTLAYMPEAGSPRTVVRTVRAGKRRLVSALGILGAGVRFSVKVSCASPVAVEQKVLDPAGAAMADEGAAQPSTAWFLPAATAGGEGTVLTVFNPGASAAQVTVECDFGPGDGEILQFQVPPSGSLSVDSTAELAPRAGDFSAVISSDNPVVVQAARRGASAFSGGTACPVTASAWQLAGGSTADGAETTIRVANPGPSAAVATVTLHAQPGPGAVTVLELAAGESATLAASALVGSGQLFGATVTADAPVTVWQATDDGQGRETAGAGSTSTGYRWHVPAGATGEGLDTLVHLYNPSPDPATFRLKYSFSRR